MDFGPEETFANGTGAEKKIVACFFVPGECFDRFLASCATLHVDIKVTAATDQGAPFSFILRHCLKPGGNPFGESL